ncbi:MAG: VWA domain-containing protein [Nocardioidaceae bacterium]
MTSGAHANRQRRGRGALVALVLGLLLTTGAVWAALQLQLLPDTVAGKDECKVTTVDVAVVPAVERAVTAAAADLADKCLRFDVVRRSTADVVAGVQDGDALPDIWVPDATWPLESLYTTGDETQVVSPCIASTPVVLVGGPAAQPATSWGAALESGRVAIPDPSTTSVGVMSLVAPQAEASTVGRTAEQAKAVLAPLAQAYAERRADGARDNVSLRSITTSSPRLVPATEQDFLKAHRANDALQAIVPGSGAMMMAFPVVARAGSSTEIVGAARDLAAWFDSADGRRELTSDGLRAGDGTAGAGGGVGKVSYLKMPAAAVVQADLRSWAVLSVPSSVLAVFDVSGSMDFVAGTQTRIQLAAGVALKALEIFPDHARVGLWAFSIDQGGPGQDWRVLEPVRRLDAVAGGRTQRALLTEWSGRLAELTTGGTGLYDTTLAAYRQGVRDYDENYSNAVILLTDGANDDPGSIQLPALLRELRGLRDPQRPVRIIGIAISQDADFASLQKIAAATGGQAYLAENPEDIVKVFAQAIASR